MRLFWEFLRADKDDGKMHMLPKGPRQKHGNLKMSDEDLPFLMEVHADLQKVCLRNYLELIGRSTCRFLCFKIVDF